MDRDSAIKGLEKFKSDFKPYCGGKADWERVDNALAVLKEQPDVVRCKDCRFGKKAFSAYAELHCDRLERCVKHDWFCADGRRRSDNGNS